MTMPKYIVSYMDGETIKMLAFDDLYSATSAFQSYYPYRATLYAEVK